MVQDYIMSPRLQLYKYQEKYLEGLRKNCIMTCEVGLGKSAMALKHYEKYGANKPLIIVAPASKVRSLDWNKEVADWLPSMTPDQFSVVSYEGFTKNVDLLLDAGANSYAYIFDEVHYVKTPSSKRGKAFVKAVQTAHQWIGLSATPMSNGWQDTCNYAIANGFVKNKTDFYRTYVVIVMQRMGMRQFPKVAGYQNLKSLAQWWSHLSKPLSREGNLDLPKAIDRVKHIAMTDDASYEQARLVRERIDAHNEPLDSSQKLMAALRNNLVELREDSVRNILASTDENIIIFYNLNSERDLILKMMKEKAHKHKKLYEQNGHAKTLPAHGQEPEKDGVLLIQYQSGSAGLNLQYASVTIFLSPTYSYQNYHQARGRTDRNGQTRTPVFYHIKVRSTVDTAIWEALSKKQDFSEKAIDMNAFFE